MSGIFAPGLLQGQSWLVTGGGTGIGKATAELAASLGARVVIASRKLENVEPAAREISDAAAAAGGSCSAVTCDIREPEQVEGMVDAVLERHDGALDVLINNAGGQFPSPALSMSVNGFNAVIRNNLSGTFYVTQAVAKKVMVPGGKGGAIVNVIANIYRGFAGMAHTGAARAGVDNLTKSLAVEWAAHKIRVNAVAPGIIMTSGMKQYPPELVRQSRKTIPFKRLGSAEEVAEPIVFLASPGASYISGETLYVDGAARLWGDLFPIPDPKDE
ncbi:MAG: SDR family oxidoreductase [Myxococcales bacterium]|nr:SDR family oxidoreductase [Myxococcales bacterium]